MGGLESFGARLKREREQRSVTLDEISLSTKISTRFLRALEEGHFEQLPGGIFNKGFVRAYARHLGIDEEQAIADYLAANGGAQPEKPVAVPEPTVLEVRAEAERDGAVARIPWGVFAIALLILALLFAIWGFYSRESQKQGRRPGVGNRSKGSASEAARPGGAKQTSPTDPAGSVVPVNEPASSPAPKSTIALASGTGPVQPAVVSPGAFVVLIKVREDSWFSITADGKPLLEEIVAGPTEKSVEARQEIVVKAGNVGAVDFFFNGKKLPPQGDYDEVKTLTFDGNGLKPAAPKTETGIASQPQ
jgi:cytoskeleton protein RodZ